MPTPNVYLMNNLRIGTNNFFAGDRYVYGSADQLMIQANGGIFADENAASIAASAKCAKLRNKGGDPMLRELLMNGVRPTSNAVNNRGVTPDIDSDTYLYWKLNGDLPSANLGTGGVLPVSYVQGNVNTQNYSLGKGQFIYNSAIAATGYPAATPNTTNITISCWVMLNSYRTWNAFFLKAYRADATWATPFTAFGLACIANTDGRWGMNLSIAATQYQVITDPLKFRIPLKEPCFLAGTYDGTTVKVYQNGLLAASLTQSGVIDYGTNGAYYVGSSLSGGNQNTDGVISDCRVDNVVRSQAYLENAYMKRMGLV